MDDILIALGLLLQPLLGTGEDQFKKVLIGNDITIRPKLKGNSLPLITLTSMSETPAPGDMAGTSKRIFRCRIRIWQKSHNPGIALQPGSSRDLYAVTDRIRTILDGDKGLQIAGDLDYQYYRMNVDTATDVAAPETANRGELIARDIMVQYWRREAWTGSKNNQTSLVAPM